MQVPPDYICEHGMPQPWATCTECMLLPRDEQPVPEKPKPPARPEPATPKTGTKARKRATDTSSSRSSPAGGRSTRAPRAPKAPKPRLPRHADDAEPDLVGSCDLAYEVPDEHVSHHVRGPDHDWLPISSFPTRLRPDGFVYLQVDQELVARARVRGVGYRDRRWAHQPTETASDLGAGPTLELHTDSWERLRIDLGPAGEREVAGYRYLVTVSDGYVRVADDEDLRIGDT